MEFLPDVRQHWLATQETMSRPARRNHANRTSDRGVQPSTKTRTARLRYHFRGAALATADHLHVWGLASGIRALVAQAPPHAGSFGNKCGLQGHRADGAGLAGMDAGARGAGTAAQSTAAVRPPGDYVGRAQQHQEERAIGLVSGGGPAAFRPEHDDLAFGRTNAPTPNPPPLFQHGFKDRQLMSRHFRPQWLSPMGLRIPLRVQMFKAEFGAIAAAAPGSG